MERERDPQDLGNILLYFNKKGLNYNYDSNDHMLIIFQTKPILVYKQRERERERERGISQDLKRLLSEIYCCTTLKIAKLQL